MCHRLPAWCTDGAGALLTDPRCHNAWPCGSGEGVDWGSRFLPRRANSPASALLSREAGFSIRLVKQKRRTRGGRGQGGIHHPRDLEGIYWLSWLAWDRPNMPWNGTLLYFAESAENGALGEPQLIAGGPTESILPAGMVPRRHTDRVSRYRLSKGDWA